MKLSKREILKFVSLIGHDKTHDQLRIILSHCEEKMSVRFGLTGGSHGYVGCRLFLDSYRENISLFSSRKRIRLIANSFGFIVSPETPPNYIHNFFLLNKHLRTKYKGISFHTKDNNYFKKLIRRKEMTKDELERIIVSHVLTGRVLLKRALGEGGLQCR